MTDITKIKLPCNISIAGNTMCGKTHLLKKLLREQLIPQLEYLIILAPTCAISDDYLEFQENTIPERGLVVQKFEDPSMFKNIISEIVESQDHLLRNYPKKRIPSIMIILDDCVGLPILQFKGIIDKLSTASRHYNISLVVLVQRITALPRTFRLNTKFMILFNCSNFTELERYIEEYVPKKYKKLINDHMEEIFNVPYNYIFTANFATRIKDRLWLNGKDNIVEQLEDKK